MGEVEHDHVWWHYYVTARGVKVMENPYESPPAHVTDGYECMICGAVPDKGAAP